MTKKYCFVVFSDPTPGREEEYNRWYDDVHLPHVLAVPGFVSARRLKLAEEPGVENTPLPGRYLALYEMETDDPDAVLRDMWSRAGTPAMTLSDAIDAPNSTHTLFTAITGPVLAVTSE
jgi:hypothetical protein